MGHTLPDYVALHIAVLSRGSIIGNVVMLSSIKVDVQESGGIHFA